MHDDIMYLAQQHNAHVLETARMQVNSGVCIHVPPYLQPAKPLDMWEQWELEYNIKMDNW